jgi:hypothetical protein
MVFHGRYGQDPYPIEKYRGNMEQATLTIRVRHTRLLIAILVVGNVLSKVYGPKFMEILFLPVLHRFLGFTYRFWFEFTWQR